ncbi:MAG: hypothetical protein Q4E91_07345 [Lachnospiraceae bacterium]|nr:hypothetical protein [Lachnospiraceae bacterium]
MRRLTKTEKAAAAAVLAMAASVAGTGIVLMKKYTRLMLQKAAAKFQDEDEKAEPEAKPEAAEEEAEAEPEEKTEAADEK